MSSSQSRPARRHPEVDGGLVPGGGGTERLPRLIGRDRALEAMLSSSEYDADLAERWGWVTRALPDAELDGFVDTMAARLASFHKTSLASVKAMVNRATLPPDAGLVATYGEFAHSLTLPGFLSRAAGVGALAAQAGPDLEYRLGEYLGMANQRTRPDLPPGRSHVRRGLPSGCPGIVERSGVLGRSSYHPSLVVIVLSVGWWGRTGWCPLVWARWWSIWDR
jgi:Enoyl-CoA hydratase/isomerase